MNDQSTANPKKPKPKNVRCKGLQNNIIYRQKGPRTKCRFFHFASSLENPQRIKKTLLLLALEQIEVVVAESGPHERASAARSPYIRCSRSAVNERTRIASPLRRWREEGSLSLIGGGGGAGAGALSLPIHLYLWR